MGEAQMMDNIELLLRLLASIICAAFLAMAYVLVGCRRRRLNAEAKLGEIERERVEWDSRSRELLQAYARIRPDMTSSVLSSLTGPEGADSLTSLGSSQLASGVQSHALVDPTQVTTLGLIGRGGFGNVYRGVWRGTPVAVKVIYYGDATKKGSLESFVKEASIMSRLRHPNIVLYMGLSILENHTISIVTELMAEGSLFHKLHGKVVDEDGNENYRTPMSLERRLSCAIDAARGLNYLHGCTPSIVHKDFKSLNLLVAADWTVKVADFGLSAVKLNTHLSSSHGGTPEWSAPEVLRNERHGLPCDIFSFGVVLWEIVMRRIPYEGLRGIQISYFVAIEGGRLPKAVPGDRCRIDDKVFDHLYRLIMDCTDPEPSARPTAEQVLSRLEVVKHLAEAKDDACEAAAEKAAKCNEPPEKAEPNELRHRAHNAKEPSAKEKIKEEASKEPEHSVAKKDKEVKRVNGRLKKGLAPLKLNLSKLA